MKRVIRSLGLRIEHRLVVIQMVVTLTTILIVEVVSVGIPAWILGQPLLAQPNWLLHLALVLAYALPVGLLMAVWISRPIARRLQRLLDISSAWLRGSLAQRIADPHPDNLGMLANQLDLLVGHLEQDEQDLDELQVRNTRLLDQVRTLAVDEERERLARELHDSVKQHLFSLTMTASAIRAHTERGTLELPPRAPGKGDTLPSPAPNQVSDMVREIEQAAQAAQRELTRLIQNLRPASLQEKGLAAALTDYTLLFRAREHILTYMDVQGSDALLPPSVAEALYRVAQEALHNVARHAQATRVDVHLRCLPERVTLTICDNGIGFRVNQVRRGLGLANMQERMLAISGRVTIDSQAGTGTTVTAEADLALVPAPEAGLIAVDRNHPDTTIENWAWLGERLVIPVGQTWPWLPADQRHLRRPLIDCPACVLRVRPRVGWLGLKRTYMFELEQAQAHAAGDAQGRTPERLPQMWVHTVRTGYAWQIGDASWTLRRVRGPGDRLVLAHNNQPLAAIQSQGRLLHGWSEIIYDGRGYSLSYVQDAADKVILADEMGEELFFARGIAALEIELRRPIPLPLLVAAAMRIIDEGIRSEETAAALS